MSAPIGNKFWELRSKHGRDTLFATPELMWEAATEYFEWCMANPWYKKEAIKGGDMAGELISIPTATPFTIHGLCLYLDCGTSYFNHFEDSLKDKPEDISKGFKQIITRIREIIYKQKFEGAVVGAYNANIIARDLGLSERTVNEHEVKNSLPDDKFEQLMSRLNGTSPAA